MGFGIRGENTRNVSLSDVAAHTAVYLELAIAALVLGTAAGIPLGVVASHSARGRPFVLGIANVARVIPSLAILTFMLPLFGVGFVPAVAALALLATAPIVINTDLGFRSVAPAALEAASAMGMTSAQRLARVEWPLAFPITFAGVRTAATEVIASAVLAAFIGAGGLGEYVTTGLQANQPQMLWTGVACIAAIALAAEFLFAFAQQRIEVRT